MHSLSLNGGLAPLAALALLNREGAYVEPGANFTSAGASFSGEVDILGWTDSSLLVGEAKMSAGGRREVDVERELSRASLLGADEYLAICPEPLSSEVHMRLRAASEAVGIPARVLDGPALLLS